MELSEIMRTQHACRYLTPDPVPDEVIHRAVEMARFAPNGGNRNPVRFVIVRDAWTRRELGQLYLPLWREVTAAVRAGEHGMTTATGVVKSTQLGFSNPEKGLIEGHHLPSLRRALRAAPADRRGLRRYRGDPPARHRARPAQHRRRSVGLPDGAEPLRRTALGGVATSFTTLPVAAEPAVNALLGIPPSSRRRATSPPATRRRPSRRAQGDCRSRRWRHRQSPWRSRDRPAFSGRSCAGRIRWLSLAGGSRRRTRTTSTSERRPNSWSGLRDASRS
jgi:nitroreductase